jgi:chorismate mutase
MLWITASAKITKVSALGVKSEDLVKKFSTRRDLLDQNIFNAVAERHRISKNPGDYIYTVARAVTADSEQERKRIQDISSSYLNGRIDGAAVQRALQRIAREPKPTRRDRRR